MPEFLRDLFSGGGFMPHGYCFLWNPTLVWLNVVSDGLIAAAYLTIPFTLMYFLRRRNDLRLPVVFVAFALFIVSCGMTHLMEIWTLWRPLYWLSGIIKAFTAVASVTTAVMLVRLVPQALAIPSPDSLRQTNDLLALSEARFRAATEGMKDAFYIFDSVRDGDTIVDFRCVEVNAVATTRLGKGRDAIVGMLYSELYASARSSGLLDSFIRVATSGEPYDREIEVAGVQHIRWVHVRAVPLRDGIAITSSDITERITVEQERELHMAVVQNMSGGLCLVSSSDGTIVYTNPKFDKMLGYDAGELKGRSVNIINDAPSPEEAQTVTERILREIGEQGEATYEVRNIRKDGRRILCEATASLLHDSTHGTFVVAVQADVTEQRRVQREAEGFFQLSLDMLCIVGFDGHFKRLNPAWTTTLGWSSEEILSRPYLDFVHPDDRASTIAEAQKVNDGGTSFAFENRYACKSGEYRMLSWRAVPSNADGIIFASVRDVTESRRLEAERRQSATERESLLQELHLRREDEHFRVLAEAIPQIVWTANPDGGLDYYNQRWFDYTGMSLEQTRGWGWEPVLHPDDLANCVDKWTEAVRTGDDYEVEYRFKQASDGRYRWHLGRARPITDATGSIVKWFGTCTDIDDQRRAQDALREGQEQLGARVAERTAQLSTLNAALGESLGEKEILLKEIHHRVKNNLQVISSLLKLHAEQVTDPAARAAFQDSQDRVRSIALLHEQLYQSKNLADVSIATYAEALIHTLLRANASGAVHLRIDAGDITLPMDAAVPFGLILNELVTNSLKHGLGGGTMENARLRVETHAEGDDLELLVADNGPGYPSGFDPANVKSLGMHLILALTKQLEGTIRFSSSGGAECRLRFPRPIPGDET